MISSVRDDIATMVIRLVRLVIGAALVGIPVIGNNKL